MWGSRGIAPHILNLGVWMGASGLHHALETTIGASITDNRLDRRLLGEIQRRYGHFEGQKNLSVLPEIEARIVQALKPVHSSDYTCCHVTDFILSAGVP